MGGQSRINTHKWEMSSYKILSWPNMIMHTVGSTDIQSTTCSARGKQYCWQDGSSRQKINLLCKISKSSYILLFDYGLWASPSNPVSHGGIAWCTSNRCGKGLYFSVPPQFLQDSSGLCRIASQRFNIASQSCQAWQSWAELGRVGQSLEELGRTWAEFGRIWQDSDRV